MHQPLKTLSGRGIGARIGKEDNWSKRERWPADDPEYIFMGFAIDRVGQALFGDKWRGDEPQGMPDWPPPLPPMSEAPNHVRGDVALSLPRTRPLFRKGEFFHRGNDEPIPELTEEEWALADAQRTAKRTANAESHARWQAVLTAMDWPLRRKELDTYARKAKSTYFAKADPKAWSIDDMEQRFRTLRLNAGAPNDDYSADRGWIFFGRDSFEAFMRRLQGVPAPTTSTPYQFDRQAEHFSLYDAVLWAATGGADTTTGEIDEQCLDEVGAGILFPLLAKEGAPLVSGLDHDMLRENIPRTYWETASVGEHSSGHMVTFFERKAVGIQAELTPYRHTKPKWTALQIKTGDLLALCPSQAFETSAAAEQQTEKRSRGRQKGDGEIDDTTRLEDIRAKMKSGVKKFRAATDVATSISDGTAKSVDSIRSRLLRKLRAD